MTSCSLMRYQIKPVNPDAHLFEVSLTLEKPNPSGQEFLLPVWIPGSYTVREFAKHIVSIQAHSEKKTLALRKLDKHRWLCDPCPGTLTVTTQVYAWDLSVRSAYLDRTRGFFNGTSVFLLPKGFESQPCLVELIKPDDPLYRNWRVATTLKRYKTRPGAFGFYEAYNYASLIDHPFELGDFTTRTFQSCGVDHEIVLAGPHHADLDRLVNDTQNICNAAIRLFDPIQEKAPFDRYAFLCAVVGDGYGGLEHRDSTALLFSRYDLPYAGMKEPTEAYRQLLGLISHEYFHAWNVKRIKPAVFDAYDYTRENYTPLLWLFEGFTSYYDDLLLVRSGVIARESYLSTLAKTMSNVLRGPGRFVQSLADASFDAWIKYYHPNENTPNAGVSYYAKGSLVALTLDATIRAASHGQRSLDDVMRALWKQFGADGAKGLADAQAFVEVAEGATGVKLAKLVDLAVNGTTDLPLEKVLDRLGVRMKRAVSKSGTGLGIKTAAADGGLKIQHVLDLSPARHAGLSAGDVLLAFDGLRVTAGTFDKILERYAPGEWVTVHAFRRDELKEFRLKIEAAPADEISLTLDSKSKAAKLGLAWLGVH